MDYNNHNTTLRTNKHLNFEERFYLEKRIVLGDSIATISRAPGRSRTTIYTERNANKSRLRGNNSMNTSMV